MNIPETHASLLKTDFSKCFVLSDETYKTVDMKQQNKKYEYIDIPDTDKHRLLPYKHKHDFIHALPKIIETHSEEYESYFITVTFHKTSANTPYHYYQEFFQFFRKKLDQYLLPHRKHFHTRPILILFPEMSPSLHFHGLLLIHKKTSEKFQKKCVSKIETVFIEKLKQNKDSIRLKTFKLKNPYPKSLQTQHTKTVLARELKRSKRTREQKKLLFKSKPMLSIDDYRIHPVTAAEFEKIAVYSSKKFLANKDFTTDHIIIESKHPPKKKNP